MAAENDLKKESSYNAQLISLIVHELRNPLTAIKGYSDLLLQETAGVLNDRQISFVRMIHSNANKMGDLITTLSDISRLETGSMNFSLAPLPVSGYLKQAIQHIQPFAEKQSIFLDTIIPSSLPRMIADPHRLNNILEHLLRNAIQYSPEGGKVTLKAEQAKAFIRISVIDQGYGVNQDLQKKVFTPFFRGLDSRCIGIEGWGMGLHLSKSLVEGMDGSIGFESQIDQGSAFWFILPVQLSE